VSGGDNAVSINDLSNAVDAATAAHGPTVAPIPPVEQKKAASAVVRALAGLGRKKTGRKRVRRIRKKATLIPAVITTPVIVAVDDDEDVTLEDSSRRGSWSLLPPLLLDDESNGSDDETYRTASIGSEQDVADGFDFFERDCSVLALPVEPLPPDTALFGERRHGYGYGEGGKDGASDVSSPGEEEHEAEDWSPGEGSVHDDGYALEELPPTGGDLDDLLAGADSLPALQPLIAAAGTLSSSAILQEAVVDPVAESHPVASSVAPLPDPLHKGSDEELYLSDIEEMLEPPSPNEPPPKLPVPGPEGEVADLLAELAAEAPGLNNGDYWTGQSWNIEALREDVEEQRQEQQLETDEVLDKLIAFTVPPPPPLGQPKPPVASNFEAAQLKVIFEPGPLGLQVQRNRGLVAKIQDGKQADRLGVRAGMCYRLVGGLPYTEQRLRSAQSGSRNYEVVFEKQVVAPVSDVVAELIAVAPVVESSKPFGSCGLLADDTIHAGGGLPSDPRLRLPQNKSASEISTTSPQVGKAKHGKPDANLLTAGSGAAAQPNLHVSAETVDEDMVDDAVEEITMVDPYM